MRILFIIDGLRKGGKERRFLELINHLYSYREIEFQIALIHHNLQYPISDYIRTRLIFIEKNDKMSLYPFWAIIKIARNFQPQVIHSWSFMMTTYSLPASLILKIKLVNSQISDAPEYINKWSYFWIQSKFNFVLSKKIISNSEAGLKSYSLSSCEKAIVINNGFDLNRLPHEVDKESIRKKFNISTKFVVAMVASFNDNKDYKTFINASMEIIQRRMDITFLCVGDGDNINFMKSLVKDEAMNKILFTGSVDKVEELISICDVGVLSTFTEGISNALLEFCASGVPVVATEGSGNQEIVLDGFNGFLCKKQDPNDLAKKILAILDNLSLQEKMSHAGKKLVEEKFSINRMVNSFLSVYREIDNKKQ